MQNNGVVHQRKSCGTFASNNLLSSKQFGFISRGSTVTQLLRYLDQYIDTIVNEGVVDTIYLEFQKAFDTIPHRRLMGKLQSYGVKGRILMWIKSFLTGRTQVIKVNGSASESVHVLSGITQGSVCPRSVTVCDLHQ